MNRRDFGLDYIQLEFRTLEPKLKRRVTIHAIGGFVMAAKGLKVGTKDIDVILEDEKQFTALVEGLRVVGYHVVSEPVMEKVYRKLAAQAILENQEGFRWDIFLRVVANKLTLSEPMKERAGPYINDGKLVVRTLSKGDIFLLKGVTERERDLEDMFRIARSGIDYDAVYEECLLQSEMTGRIWETGLCDNCELLEEKYNLSVPFLSRLRKKGEQKLFLRIIKREVKAGHDSEKSIAIAASGHLTRKDVRDVLADLSKQGEIEIRKGKVTVPKKTRKK